MKRALRHQAVWIGLIACIEASVEWFRTAGVLPHGARILQSVQVSRPRDLRPKLQRSVSTYVRALDRDALPSPPEDFGRQDLSR